MTTAAGVTTPAADAGRNSEEDEGNQRLILFGREQRAGDGKHRDPEIIEQLERGRDGVCVDHRRLIHGTDD